MTSPSDLWPAAGLSVRAGDLTLAPVSDDDLPELVDLALAGIHPPGFMPFSTPWTAGSRDELPRRYAQYQWAARARFDPADFNLELAVRRGGELVGCQGCGGRDFPVVRTAETGSWLGLPFQGQGIGTRMRQMICALLFDHLGAVEVTSEAFSDNPASLAVSRKVGYRENGRVRVERQGEPAVSIRLVLTPDTLVRGAPVTVDGAEPLRRFLGVGGS